MVTTVDGTAYAAAKFDFNDMCASIGSENRKRGIRDHVRMLRLPHEKVNNPQNSSNFGVIMLLTCLRGRVRR